MEIIFRERVNKTDGGRIRRGGLRLRQHRLRTETVQRHPPTPVDKGQAGRSVQNRFQKNDQAIPQINRKKPERKFHCVRRKARDA